LDFKTILFYALAVIVLAPAVMVMVAKDIIRVAFWLLASLSGVAGMYILLDADFLGATQVLVYIGGILVLILFGIMMTHRDPIMIEVEDVRRRSPAVGLAVGLVMFGALLGLVLGTGWDTGTGRDTGAVTTPDLGRALLTDYILPFEIISVLLLVVLCGSAYIARRGKEAPHA
jgi:NADH-quinone oxidoreductase subunit J